MASTRSSDDSYAFEFEESLPLDDVNVKETMDSAISGGVDTSKGSKAEGSKGHEGMESSELAKGGSRILNRSESSYKWPGTKASPEDESSSTKAHATQSHAMDDRHVSQGTPPKLTLPTANDHGIEEIVHIGNQHPSLLPAPHRHPQMKLQARLQIQDRSEPPPSQPAALDAAAKAAHTAAVAAAKEAAQAAAREATQTAVAIATSAIKDAAAEAIRSISRAASVKSSWSPVNEPQGTPFGHAEGGGTNGSYSSNQAPLQRVRSSKQWDGSQPGGWDDFGQRASTASRLSTASRVSTTSKASALQQSIEMARPSWSAAPIKALSQPQSRQQVGMRSNATFACGMVMEPFMCFRMRDTV